MLNSKNYYNKNGKKHKFYNKKSKYKKKIRNIPNKLIQNKYSLYQDYNISLFCINTGSINYSIVSFMKSKIIMEYLFPKPTIYEKKVNSLSYLTFKTILFIENEFMQYKIKKYNNLEYLERKIKKYSKKIILLKIILVFHLCFIFYKMFWNIYVKVI